MEMSFHKMMRRVMFFHDYRYQMNYPIKAHEKMKYFSINLNCLNSSSSESIFALDLSTLHKQIYASCKCFLKMYIKKVKQLRSLVFKLQKKCFLNT